MIKGPKLNLTYDLSSNNNKKYFYHNNNNYFCTGINPNCNAEHR